MKITVLLVWHRKSSANEREMISDRISREAVEKICIALNTGQFEQVRNVRENCGLFLSRNAPKSSIRLEILLSFSNGTKLQAKTCKSYEEYNS